MFIRKIMLSQMYAWRSICQSVAGVHVAEACDALLSMRRQEESGGRDWIAYL
jgi:hypothetical protein